MAQYTAHNIRHAGDWTGAFDICTLSYDDRFLRRRVITTAAEKTLLVDLPHTTSLNDRDAFELTDGRLIEIIAAKETLLAVTGDDLVTLAWHIGNRHTPCQIEAGRLLIQSDPVIGHMLQHLGARVREVREPFTPEGGAYGHGRTLSHHHGHDHGATAHDG